MYSYSTDVCGYLVEAISGQRFDQYLQENIFDPLDMKDTSFCGRASASSIASPPTTSGKPDKTLKLIDDPERSTYLKQPTFFSGGGGLTGTTADYLRFCEMLRRGGELDGARILGSRTLELMHRNHLAGGKDLASMAIGAFSETANEGVGFGLGFAMTLGEVEAGDAGRGRLLLGRRGLDDFLGRPERGPGRDFHDPADAVSDLQLPRPAEEHHLLGDRRLSDLDGYPFRIFVGVVRERPAAKVKSRRLSAITISF